MPPETTQFSVIPYLVDAIVVAVFIIFMIACAKKGFVGCIFGLISSTLALLVSTVFAGVIVDLTGGLFGLEGTLTASFTEAFSAIEGFNIPIEGEVDLQEALASQDISAVLAGIIAQNFTTVPEGYTLGMMIGETLGDYATLLISGTVTFSVLIFVLSILRRVFNLIAKTHSLNALNRLLGAGVGFIEALLVASVAVSVLSMFPEMTGILNSSVILTTIYNNNPLIWLLSLFLVA